MEQQVQVRESGECHALWLQAPVQETVATTPVEVAEELSPALAHAVIKVHAQDYDICQATRAAGHIQ